MKIEEFYEENKKLERLFEKELTDEQTQEWYKALKNLTVMQYRYVVGEIYRTLSYFPKLAQVLDVVKEARFYEPEQKKEEEKVECKKCNSTGIIWYKKFDAEMNTIYNYVAKCDCKNGNKYKSFPSINQLGLNV